MESNMMKNIISINRKRKNLTQEDLASLIGVSKSVVSKWESGRRYPDVTIIPILSDILEVSIEELFSGIPKKREKIIIYDEKAISKFKERVLFSIIMMVAPLFCFVGTVLKSLELFFLLLGAGIVLAVIGAICVLKEAKAMKSIIIREYGKPKYSIIYKNYLLMFLFVLYVELFILLTYFVPKHIMLFGVILYVVFIVFIILSFINLGIEIKNNRFIPLVVLSIIVFITGLLLMNLLSAFPYCVLLLVSQIINFIMFAIQNNYVK